jgi:hypothetical protein
MSHEYAWADVKGSMDSIPSSWIQVAGAFV